MSLSSELVSQFVKATKDDTKKKSETTVYGTTVEYNGATYVQLDGSELLTPVTTTTDVAAGERVAVMIKNHTATITGNVSSPSAKSSDVKEMGNQISEFQIIIADRVTTEQLNAERARIDTLVAENVTIAEKMTAYEADIDEITAKNVAIEKTLTAAEASIESLQTGKLDADLAEITYAKANDLEVINQKVYNLDATYGEFADLSASKFKAIEADILDLDTGKLSAIEAEVKYANIDFTNIGEAAIEYFYAKSGLIENVVVGDGTITGNLVGVTIKGDLIEGGTVVADKLVIQGEDGLYYKLNTNGMTTETEQTEYNSINGSIITAKSITATKISVKDLVAFDATIGGYHITDSSLYSGAKSSAFNSTRGVYMDSDGQFSVGDAQNFMRYYREPETGEYKLAISAKSITLSASDKNLEDVIEDLEDIRIGARNLIRNSKNLVFADYYFEGQGTVMLTATHDGLGNVTLHGDTLVCTHDGAGNVILRY